jgi:branched-chain amino acid aminotransferase
MNLGRGETGAGRKKERTDKEGLSSEKGRGLMEKGGETEKRGTHVYAADPRNEDILIYLNGELVPRDEAKVSVFDSGFCLGDGVWEGIRLHNGRFFALDRHLGRLFEGARVLALDIGMSQEELTAALYDTVRANGMESGVHVRLMVTRGLKRTPSQDPRVNVGGPTVVIIAEHKVPDTQMLVDGIHLTTSHIRRGRPDVQDPRLNSHSKLNCVLAMVQALAVGADEALMLDPHGFVSTCNATNFFMIRRGEVWTSTGRYCMNGITRGFALELAREAGYGPREKDFSLTDVYSADEAFVTGTFAGMIPVVSVDGLVIGSGERGPITLDLQERYNGLVERETRTG